MFDSFFKHRLVNNILNQNKNTEQLQQVIFYTFKTENGIYCVEVEEYIYNIFVLKFYPKSHANNPQRFNIILNNKKQITSKIIRTVINIMLEILSNKEFANFGFIGSNIIDNNFIESKYASQRFRIYKNVMLNFFDSNKFLHFENQTNSAYLLINKKNEHFENLLLSIQKMFIDNYPELDTENV